MRVMGKLNFFGEIANFVFREFSPYYSKGGETELYFPRWPAVGWFGGATKVGRAKFHHKLKLSGRLTHHIILQNFGGLGLVEGP